MRDTFRFHRSNWLTSGAYFAVFPIAFLVTNAAVLPYSLAAVSLISFAAWVVNYRRLRQIEDTPVSNIASAAQGYAEISGHAEEPAGMPIRSRITDAACVWFHYEIRTEKGDLLESGDSDDPFVVRDATGQCVVDPEGAEVFTSRRDAWTHGGRRYVEYTLLPRDPIYALGEFTTLGGTTELDLDTDVGALLAEWKKNQPELLKRFDLNRDGAVGLGEWELARRQARREVEAREGDSEVSVGTNVLRKPADGKRFLISNCLPDKIRNGYLIWTWVHIVIFIGTGTGAFALL